MDYESATEGFNFLQLNFLNIPKHEIISIHLFVRVLQSERPYFILKFPWSISQNYTLSGETGLELVCPLRIKSPQSVDIIFPAVFSFHSAFL